MGGSTVAGITKSGIRYLFPPLIGLAGIGTMFQVSRSINAGALVVFRATQYPEINQALSRQIYVLPVSVLAVAIMYAYDPENVRSFFRVGDIDATAEPLRLLGISADDSWKRIGPLIAGLVTLGTGVFMAQSVNDAGGRLTPAFVELFPYVLLLSAANAWNEEIFTRFVPVAGLWGRMSPKRVYWVSALVFGLPHFFGTPGGYVGVLMAGFLGWLLAKTVGETRGLFWAWSIHFVQDVVIFAGLLLILFG